MLWCALALRNHLHFAVVRQFECNKTGGWWYGSGQFSESIHWTGA